MPPRVPLVARLSEGPTTSLVPYNAELASRNAGLHALAVPDPSSLSLVFPTPSAPQVPVLQTINEEGLSRFLIIWNLPPFHLWENVISWICAVWALVPSVRLKRVIRSNEGGEQVFWLAFKTSDHASTFRGQVAGREAEGGVVVACEFVSQDEYCSVTGPKPLSWYPSGYSEGLTPLTPLTEGEEIRQPTPALAARLGQQLAPAKLWTHRKPKRGRRKKKGPADGGAL
ncbi:hypothetical protein CPC08DRAFT_731115 [Agrocybe pediades]|nr:hypothetical protein CPC08DRAFT_731115 [Agrocybe pediades]